MIKIKYNMDIAYKLGIRKVPRIVIEDRGYEIIKQLSEIEFIIENKKKSRNHI